MKTFPTWPIVVTFGKDFGLMQMNAAHPIRTTMTIQKMTENETISLLMKHLTGNGWQIVSYCLGQTKGCDIIASKNGTLMYIEVKGARAADTSPTKKRQCFDSGQIKTHFGKAIVKILDLKRQHPDAQFAIAHPDDSLIRKTIGPIVPYLSLSGITHFWVSANGDVTEEFSGKNSY